MSNSETESQCPMKGCDGTGHILGIFSTHRSLSGCPLGVRIAELQQNSDTKVCPTPGCDGTGNTKSMYAFHRSVQRCPLMREKLEEYKGALTVKQVEDMLLKRIPFPFPNGVVGSKLLNGGGPGKKSPSQMDTSSRANGKGATVADKNGENKSPKTATGLSSQSGDSRKAGKKGSKGGTASSGQNEAALKPHFIPAPPMSKSGAFKKKATPFAASLVNGSALDHSKHITFLPNGIASKRANGKSNNNKSTTIKLDHPKIKEETLDDEQISISLISPMNHNNNKSSKHKVPSKKSTKIIKVNNENAQANGGKVASKKRKLEELLSIGEVKPNLKLISHQPAIKSKGGKVKPAEVLVEPLDEASVQLSLLNCDLESFDLIEEQNRHLANALLETEEQLKTLQNEEFSYAQNLSRLQKEVAQVRAQKAQMDAITARASAAFVKACKELAPLNRQILPAVDTEEELISVYLERIAEIAQQRDESAETEFNFNLLKDNLKGIWEQLHM